ncbi:MAG TPA: hypothetical protein VKA76_00010 [Gammaproteobacteria bacterium]|nr:hypothetical protein [Gammaproteobacteria bacterium]
MAFINQASERMHDTAERVSETTHGMAERAERAGESISRFGRRAADRSRESLSTLPRSMKRHPYRTAGAVAAAAATGVAIWALLRRR